MNLKSYEHDITILESDTDSRLLLDRAELQIRFDEFLESLQPELKPVSLQEITEVSFFRSLTGKLYHYCKRVICLCKRDLKCYAIMDSQSPIRFPSVSLK